MSRYTPRHGHSTRPDDVRSHRAPSRHRVTAALTALTALVTLAGTRGAVTPQTAVVVAYVSLCMVPLVALFAGVGIRHAR